MNSKAYWRAVIVGLAILLGIFAIGCGCRLDLLAAAPPSGHAKPEVQVGPNTVFAYAQGAEIHLYQDGDDRVVGRNPAGYDSMDFWLGYSRSQSGIVFCRGFDDRTVHLIHIDSGRTKLHARSFTGSGYPERSSGDLSLSGDKLSQIRGHGRSVELWPCPIDGKWQKKHC